GGISTASAQALVADWCERYRCALGAFRDSDGFAPRHTFFYPWDEYEPGCLDQLATFCGDGYGEVEIHLHHRNDTEEGVRQKLTQCRDTYQQQHGFLGRRRQDHAVWAAGSGEATALPAYAFVHGNWCLCNGRPDGDWCGVSRELSILSDTGCYADLTFPSAPSPTQPRIVNTIHYGADPRAGERGPRVLSSVTQGGGERQSAVMMIPGPLALNWGGRKWGCVPRLENGELSGASPATPQRLQLWRRVGVHVPGRPEWTVVKLHTHGCIDENQPALLGPSMVAFHRTLAAICAEDRNCRLHYVTARELFNILKAAESGQNAAPGAYRDFVVGPPPVLSDRI
ncbi:MAG: hypothetical protein HN341_00220, partial [Verrucomicrobia bacterium]|nr:hypothetical protein [Verrucomicrobiota bacterium]